MRVARFSQFVRQASEGRRGAKQLTYSALNKRLNRVETFDKQINRNIIFENAIYILVHYYSIEEMHNYVINIINCVCV